MPQSSVRAVRVWMIAGALGLVCAASQAIAQTSPAIPVAPTTSPHPLAQGTPVVDRAGVQVGVITAIADSDRGPMVVVEVKGKLLSLPEATLTLDGAIVRSSQTKAQMLSAAATP